jgi:hypothetical protein
MTDELLNNKSINNDDLIYYKENGQIMSGGFQINSILLKNQIPFMNSYMNGGKLNKKKKEDSEIESDDNDNINDSNELFSSDIAVPSGLLFIKSSLNDYNFKNKTNVEYEFGGVLGEDIFSELNKLMKHENEYQIEKEAESNELKEINTSLNTLKKYTRNNINKIKNKKNKTKKNKGKK